MAIESYITEGGNNKHAAIFDPAEEGRNGKPGLQVYTSPRHELPFLTSAFTNEIHGRDLNQNIGFTGTPECIHDGTDSVLWAATALSGTWDFASTTQAHTGTMSVDATSVTKDKQAQFEAASPVDASDYTSVAGWIYITSWSTTGTKDVEICFMLAGVLVGVKLNISLYVNTGDFNVWQQFIIPMSDFQAGTDVDQLIITQISEGAGSPANWFLDDICMQETGGFADFFVAPPTDEIWHIEKIGYAIAANVTEANMNSYDKFFGIPALTNGLLTVIQVGGFFLASASLRRTFDRQAFPHSSPLHINSDGINTMCKVTSDTIFPLDGREGDKLGFRVQDDLSSLLEFRAWITGVRESI